MHPNSKDHLGVGWAFPVSVDARGRVNLARHERDIEQAIKMILRTSRGQRQMRPEFGCRIDEMVFAPNDANTAGLAAYHVEEALAMWEPRIVVREVHVEVEPEHPERMILRIDYEIRATHERRSLVYPFYRIPGEDA